MSNVPVKPRVSKLKAKKPEDREPTKPKIAIFGPSGIGKTWMALDFPGCYYIDTEGGSSRKHYMAKLAKSGGMIMGPEDGACDFDVVLEQVKALATEDHEYDTLVIDSLTKLFNAAIVSEQERMEKAGEKEAFGNSKKPALSYMRRLVNWINRLDMNVVIILQEKVEWGKDEKTGEQVAIGKTFDCWDKLEYELDLVIGMLLQGATRYGLTRKSRLTEFPNKERFELSFEKFAEKYGKDVINRKAKHIVLASAENIAEVVRLVQLLKLTDEEITKWWTKWNIADWNEMSESQAANAIKFLNDKINPTKEEK